MRTRDDIRRYHTEYMRRYRLAPDVKAKIAEYAKRKYADPMYHLKLREYQRTEKYKRHIAEHRARPEVIARTAAYEASERRKQLNKLSRQKPERRARHYAQHKQWRRRNWTVFLEAQRRRYATDTAYHLLMRLRNQLGKAVTRDKRTQSTLILLGCSIEAFKKWLESQFELGMSWENYGRNGWHIDHIIPCSKFDLTDPDQQRICFNYRNLRPLWEQENEWKHNMLPPNWRRRYKAIEVAVRDDRQGVA